MNIEKEFKKIISALDLNKEEENRLVETFNKMLVAEIVQLLSSSYPEISSLLENPEKEKNKEEFNKIITNLEKKDKQLYDLIKGKSRKVMKSFLQTIYDSASMPQKEKLKSLYS